MPVNNKLQHPRVTVFVPAFNEEKLIGLTLERLRNQDFDEEYELLVIDNASTDMTAELAKRHGARVVREEQKGNRFAVERGFAEARGDIIIQTDADTLPDDQFVRVLADAYRDTDVIAAGTRITFYDAAPWFTKLFRLLTVLNFRESMWGASLSATKQAWQEVGGFNQGFDLNADAYFTLQLRKVGKVAIIKNYYLPMSGRRYSGNPLRVIWNSKDLMINGLYMMFTGRPLLRKPFKDIR